MPINRGLLRGEKMTKCLTAHKKGITPIIAIIILLLITIALAGAAYSYISTYW
jgi:flagellin-like protein